MLVTVDEFVENIKKSLYVHTFIDDGDDGIKGYTQLLNKALKKTKREMIQEDFFFPILAHGLDKEDMHWSR